MNGPAYDTDLGEFVSDYYAMSDEAKKDSSETIAESYIESCLVTSLPMSALKAEVQRLIPQIDYYR